MTIRLLTNTDAPQVARIHLDGLPDDFLASFGLGFITTLYEYLLVSPHVIAHGIFDNNSLVGIIVGADNTSQLLSSTMKKGFWKFMPHIVKRILVKPQTVIFLFQTLFYGKTYSDLPQSELVVLSIQKSYRSKKFGSQLMDVLKKSFKQKNITQFKVGTHTDNTIANNFYQKHGAIFHHRTTIYNHDWNIYLCTIP